MRCGGIGKRGENRTGGAGSRAAVEGLCGEDSLQGYYERVFTIKVITNEKGEAITASPFNEPFVW